MTEWVSGNIIKIIHWTNRLFTIILNANTESFIPGQFAKIGIKHNNKIIQRAYSYLNPPNNTNLEFYIAAIKSGQLTNLLHNLHENDTIMISKKSYGKFTLKNIPSCTNLWMIGSGTGISPYLSILNSCDQKLKNFSNIILIHAVRYSKNLNYLHKMMNLKKIYYNKLFIQTILSREQSPTSLSGYIPDLIKTDILEQKVGISLNINSHIMLCGNPNMIKDTKKILYKKYGLQDHSSRNKGHITQERYW